MVQMIWIIFWKLLAYTVKCLPKVSHLQIVYIIIILIIWPQFHQLLVLALKKIAPKARNTSDIDNHHLCHCTPGAVLTFVSKDLQDWVYASHFPC